MPPRPLYRWKSFWFGLLVIAFPGWAWVISMYQISSFMYKSPGNSNASYAGNDSGTLDMGLWRDSPIPEGFHPFSELYTSQPSDRGWFPAAASLKKSAGHGMQRLLIAHWFLILLFLLPWTAFLFWRSRRMKRLQLLSRSAPAAP